MDKFYYKISQKIFSLLKINLLTLVFSLTIVGIGSAISTGFYALKKSFLNNSDITVKDFYIHFKKNFRFGLFASSPLIFLSYYLSRFLFILKDGEIKMEYTVLFLLLNILSFMFVLLLNIGVYEKTIKELLFYTIYTFMKKYILMIVLNFALLVIFFIVIKFSPGILIFLNIVIPMSGIILIFKELIKKGEEKKDERI